MNQDIADFIKIGVTLLLLFFVVLTLSLNPLAGKFFAIASLAVICTCFAKSAKEFFFGLPFFVIGLPFLYVFTELLYSLFIIWSMPAESLYEFVIGYIVGTFSFLMAEAVLLFMGFMSVNLAVDLLLGIRREEKEFDRIQTYSFVIGIILIFGIFIYGFFFGVTSGSLISPEQSQRKSEIINFSEKVYIQYHGEIDVG